MLLGFAAPPAHAESSEQRLARLTEMPFESLLEMQVYSASKFEQKISDAPSVATVITAEEIKAYGWRTLADALNSIRGLYVTNDRNYNYLGARGFLRPGDYNSRFLLLVDGYRLNDVVYDQAPIGSDFILDPELISRIEYIPGPGSSVYGSNAFFGVINVISKPVTEAFGTRLSVEAGSFGARRAGIRHGWEMEGGMRFLLSASRSVIRGQDLYYPEFNTPAANNGIARRLDFDRSSHLLFKTELGNMTLSLMHAERNKGIPTASFEQAFNEPASHTVDTQSAIKLDYRTALNNRTDLSWQAFIGRHDYVGSYVYDGPPITVMRDGGIARWWGGEVKIVSTAFDRHKLVAGAEYQRDARRDQYNHDLDPYRINLHDRRSGYRAALYAQDEFALRPDLLLNAGLRYDRVPSAGSNVSPRVALVWHGTPSTTVKAIMGSAFRAPNAYELYYEVAGDGGQKANPSLEPEKIRSTELALEHQFSENARATISVFRNGVTNLISQVMDSDGLLIFRNLDRVTARGVELGYERIWSGDTRLRTSYSWQRSTDKRTGLTPVNSPEHLAKLNISKRVAPNLRAAFEAYYVSKRSTKAGNTAAYWVGNGTLLYSLGKNTEASISLYNLFDRRYADPGSGEHLQDSIAQDGRSMRIRFAHRF
ncbi:MAG: hypothetical protein A3I66_24145 [Burkholderiales bacterium RIFCSPLOWO2_02_FULL_57_36]|nr:MAG: hypothetical protein A3I66_24145 [Burkholderiales bacterium RIFCSPLOWO2_02_FULL_57_36]